MKLLKIMAASAVFCIFSTQSFAQTLADIDDTHENNYGLTVPGLACKTRTNTDSSVRNLAHGVVNVGSDTPVALNCAWTTNYTSTTNVNNGARVWGEYRVGWVRTAGTSLASANEAFCTINMSAKNDTNINPVAEGLTIGTVEANFTGTVSDAEFSSNTISDFNLTFPSGVIDGTVSGAFLSAFCLLPKGVRLQLFDYDPDGVQNFNP